MPSLLMTKDSLTDTVVQLIILFPISTEYISFDKIVFYGHWIDLPPSTARVWPHTNEASVEAKNAMHLATSNGFPILPIG